VPGPNPRTISNLVAAQTPSDSEDHQGHRRWKAQELHAR
jgi:hypothetical protein